jgi:hypothetical protein
VQCLAPEPSAERADHALGHGLDPRAAPARSRSPHPVANLEILRIAGGDPWQIVARDLKHGDVGLRVGADELARERAPVGQRDKQLPSSGDNAVVGQDVPLGIVQHARPDAGRHAKPLIELANLDLLTGDLYHRGPYVGRDLTHCRGEITARRGLSGRRPGCIKEASTSPTRLTTPTRSSSTASVRIERLPARSRSIFMVKLLSFGTSGPEVRSTSRDSSQVAVAANFL